MGCDETNGNAPAREFGPIHGLEKLVPSSKLRVRYGNHGPFIDDLAMKNCDFPVPYVKLPKGTTFVVFFSRRMNAMDLLETSWPARHPLMRRVNVAAND